MMKEDLVGRLRELDKKGYQPLTGAIGREAADEIERLRAKLNLASEALNAHNPHNPLLPPKDEYRHLLVKETGSESSVDSQ